MNRLFLIGLAGFIRRGGRYWVSGVVARRYGGTFSLGTLIVNLIGCFLVGLLFYLLQERFRGESNSANGNLDRVLWRVHYLLHLQITNLYAIAGWRVRLAALNLTALQFHWPGIGVGWIHLGPGFYEERLCTYLKMDIFCASLSGNADTGSSTRFTRQSS